MRKERKKKTEKLVSQTAAGIRALNFDDLARENVCFRAVRKVHRVCATGATKRVWPESSTARHGYTLHSSDRRGLVEIGGGGGDERARSKTVTSSTLLLL